MSDTVEQFKSDLVETCEEKSVKNCYRTKKLVNNNKNVDFTGCYTPGSINKVVSSFTFGRFTKKGEDIEKKNTAKPDLVETCSGEEEEESAKNCYWTKAREDSKNAAFTRGHISWTLERKDGEIFPFKFVPRVTKEGEDVQKVMA